VLGTIDLVQTSVVANGALVRQSEQLLLRQDQHLQIPLTPTLY
jgi:hypothetical protein